MEREHCRLGDTIRREDASLTLRRGAAVTAHRGHHERVGTSGPQPRHHCRRHVGDAIDAPAPHGDSDPLPRPVFVRPRGAEPISQVGNRIDQRMLFNRWRHEDLAREHRHRVFRS